MELPGSTVAFLVVGSLCSVLQLCWIASLLKRNKRFRGSQPLSARAFRQELERIFRNGI